MKQRDRQKEKQSVSEAERKTYRGTQRQTDTRPIYRQIRKPGLKQRYTANRQRERYALVKLMVTVTGNGLSGLVAATDGITQRQTPRSCIDGPKPQQVSLMLTMFA